MIDTDELKGLIGVRIKEARLNVNLTARELGEKINKSTATISMVERKETLPPINNVLGIAEATNEDPCYLAGLTHERYNAPAIYKPDTFHPEPAIRINKAVLFNHGLSDQTLIQYQSQQDVDTIQSGDFVYINPKNKSGAGVFLMKPPEGVAQLVETSQPNPSHCLGKVVATFHIN